MLARFRKAMEEREEGFTLIELLVVMIIIGILAAIAIPVFLSQKDKAKTTSAKSDVSVIGKDVASYYVDGTGGLTLSTTAAGGTWQLKSGNTVVDSGKLSAGNTTDTTKQGITDDSNWCVQVTSGDTAKTVYSYSAANGLKQASCSGAKLDTN